MSPAAYWPCFRTLGRAEQYRGAKEKRRWEGSVRARISERDWVEQQTEKAFFLVRGVTKLRKRTETANPRKETQSIRRDQHSEHWKDKKATNLSSDKCVSGVEREAVPCSRNGSLVDGHLPIVFTLRARSER